MTTTTRTQLYNLASKAKRFTIERNDHNESFAIVRRHQATNKILEGVRCFVSGQCLDLSSESSIPLSPHEAAQLLKLV